MDFVSELYRDTFNFAFEIRVSTRPENYLGDLELWNEAEQGLMTALEGRGISWELEEGEGAFYGPKIDVVITDALQRQHQCATIQLDFQLPERFQLNFTNSGTLCPCS